MEGDDTQKSWKVHDAADGLEKQEGEERSGEKPLLAVPSLQHWGKPTFNLEDTQDEENEKHLPEVDSESGDASRASWGGKLEFIFTCVGYAVGLGNVWRFPYLAYKNGGGAFLVPYVLMLCLVGLPLFFMELSFGQFASLGPIAIWKINPLFKGLGYAAVIVSWLIGLYYNVVISHTLFYLVASMTSQLPWTTCGNDWNTEHCKEPDYDGSAVSVNYSTAVNATVASNLTVTLSNVTSSLPDVARWASPAEEYYNYYVLEKSEGIEEFGLPSWKLLLALLVAWVIVGGVLIKGVTSLGKVVYFTALFPYVMLTVLLIRGLTLPGAGQGILYYLKPDFSRLSDSRVWSDAATQIFYSLSACSGGLIAMSSFNKFNNNCLRDSLIVALINCATSVYAGFVIFAVLGFMAHEKGVDVSQVAAGGPGLAFVVYPEALARMPVAPVWAVFFFIMMATLGFGSQFSIMECVYSALIDEFPRYLSGKRNSIIFRVVATTICFLLGIPMLSKGGIYLLNLVDYSVSGFPLLFVGLLECVALTMIYGYDRFAADIEIMLGHKPNLYWKICWKYVSPLIIGVVIIFSCVQYKAPTYDETDGSTYHYPAWAEGLGWLIALFPILSIPALYLFQYCRDGGWYLLKQANKPLASWGPAKAEDRANTLYAMLPDLTVNGEEAAEYMDDSAVTNNGFVSSSATIVKGNKFSVQGFQPSAGVELVHLTNRLNV